MERFEYEITDHTNSYIKKLFKDINNNLLRKFNKEFKNDKGGAHRNWVSIEEDQIKKLWV